MQPQLLPPDLPGQSSPRSAAVTAATPAALLEAWRSGSSRRISRLTAPAAPKELSFCMRGADSPMVIITRNRGILQGNGRSSSSSRRDPRGTIIKRTMAFGQGRLVIVGMKKLKEGNAGTMNTNELSDLMKQKKILLRMFERDSAMVKKFRCEPDGILRSSLVKVQAEIEKIRSRESNDDKLTSPR
jgi:hypothetical protein